MQNTCIADVRIRYVLPVFANDVTSADDQPCIGNASIRHLLKMAHRGQKGCETAAYTEDSAGGQHLLKFAILSEYSPTKSYVDEQIKSLADIAQVMIIIRTTNLTTLIVHQ